MLAPFGGGHRVGHGERRFADAGRPDQQGAGAALQPAAEQRVQLRAAGGRELADEGFVVLGRDQARIDLQPARLDGEVVIAAAEVDAAHLDHAKPAALGAVIKGHLLQGDDAVGDAVQLQVVHLGRQIVEQHHGAAPAGEEVLQRQDLPAVAQRVLGQQPHLRERVEDDADRLDLVDAVEDQLRGFAQLHLGRMQERQLAVGIERGFRRDQLEDGYSVQRPAMPRGHDPQLPLAFGQRDVKPLFAPSHAVEQELQGERRLARARPSFDQVQPVGIEAAAEDVIKASVPSRYPMRFFDRCGIVRGRGSHWPSNSR